MRAIDELCDRAFDATAFGYLLGKVRSAAPEAGAMQNAGRAEFGALLERLERELGERAFLCGDALSIADLGAICHVPMAHLMRLRMSEFPRLAKWEKRMLAIAAVSLAQEFEGPDGRIHWRDSRLEWPIRHGFVDFVAREYHSGKMMFPPDAS